MKLTKFTIDGQDRVARGGLPSANERACEMFSTEHEFAAAVASWPLSRLVRVWNALPGVTAVRKFTDRATAIRRIWRQIEMNAARPATTARPPLKLTIPTKGEHVVTLLMRPEGASLGELRTITGWKAHTVRGFISRQVGRKLGVRVHSYMRENERVYKIRKPASS